MHTWFKYKKTAGVKKELKNLKEIKIGELQE